MRKYSRRVLYSGLVWIFSGFILTVYGILGLLNTNVPGVEELVSFASSADGYYIYSAAFITMFVEGLYLVGNFLPGATLVIIIAALSQAEGIPVFILTMISIFLGWCAAGVLNVTLAKIYRLKIVKANHDPDFNIQSKLWTTWFPAFRANYEVAQVAEGGEPVKVFLSSLKVRFWASLAVAGTALLAPLFIDINTVSNEEGFISVAVVAAICYLVGILKIRKSKSNQTS